MIFYSKHLSVMIYSEVMSDENSTYFWGFVVEINVKYYEQHYLLKCPKLLQLKKNQQQSGKAHGSRYSIIQDFLNILFNSQMLNPS